MITIKRGRAVSKKKKKKKKTKKKKVVAVDVKAHHHKKKRVDYSNLYTLVNPPSLDLSTNDLDNGNLPLPRKKTFYYVSKD